jgi:uroporphyrinogen-III synthase
MHPGKIQILSTRPLPVSLIEEADEAGIQIDAISFIETEALLDVNVCMEIEEIYLQSASVVFTSMNAVEAVATQQDDQQPDWEIYCTGNTTRKLVADYFGEEKIAGAAASAAELAGLIIENRLEREVIFFCGDQRREELPGLLEKNNIDVREVVVYQTIEVPHHIEKVYAGILFFSPSAVDSFFRNNKMNEKTIVFAIGNTTANTIKKYCSNTVITGDEPGKAELVRLAIDFFKT